MPGTDAAIDPMRILSELLKDCHLCFAEFNEHVGMLLYCEGSRLADDQAAAVLAHLLDLHAGH